MQQRGPILPRRTCSGTGREHRGQGQQVLLCGQDQDSMSLPAWNPEPGVLAALVFYRVDKHTLGRVACVTVPSTQGKVGSSRGALGSQIQSQERLSDNPASTALTSATQGGTDTTRSGRDWGILPGSHVWHPVGIPDPCQPLTRIHDFPESVCSHVAAAAHASTQTSSLAAALPGSELGGRRGQVWPTQHASPSHERAGQHQPEVRQH